MPLAKNSVKRYNTTTVSNGTLLGGLMTKKTMNKTYLVKNGGNYVS